MKKYLLMGAAAAMVLAFTSCKSSESAYKKAYEKAQAAQTTETQQQQDLVPVETTPVQTVTTTPTETVQEDYSNVSVRTEEVSFVSGAALKAYSVVVGSFGVQSNATTLAGKLQGEGYTPSVVKANVNGMTYYRVVAGTSDSKGTAVALRNKLASRFNGAWLLYQK